MDFNKLPEEMQIEAFGHLDSNSVKEAALVCSHWNRVISTTPAIMKRFILRIEPTHLSPDGEVPNEKFRQLMTLERHFTDAYIYIHQNFVQSRLTDVVERFGSKIVRFTLESAWLNAEYLRKLLNNLPELEELNLLFWFPYDQARPAPDTSVVDFVTLEKLKNLMLEDDFKVFHFLRAPALLCLETRGTVEDGTNFESFLKACPLLESLSVNFGIFGTMGANFPFRLKTLVDTHLTLEFNENIKAFLLSQAATVETFEASCEVSEFHEIVLTKFMSIRVLKTNLCKLRASPQFYRTLKPLPFVTEISTFFGFWSEVVLRAILGNCPALKILECQGDPTVVNELEFIADHNKNLEVLKISPIVETNAKFRCLKTLSVTGIKNSEHLIAFLKANPTIETFEVRYLERNELSGEALEVLINETSLKHVLIEGEDCAILAVYERIKQGFGTWKTLQLSINDGSTTGMPIYNFRFPKNSAEWNPPEQLTDNNVEYHE